MVDRFDKKMTVKILPKFNNAKEWSDLMAIIKNLKENLKKYKTFNISKLTDKVLMAKRLAQSLNPSLPGGLHEITLEVYDMIYENIRTNNGNLLGFDLGLYSSGLFPIFQFATVPNKTLYLNSIIKKHYLELTSQELVLCLPGLFASILPGLDDQNETLLKTLKEIFLKARQKVGDNCFYGILWSVILRTQRLRLVGMKYINDTVPLYKTIEENPDTKDEYISNYYPNLSVLVINALTAVIEDENVQVQRLALDYIISRLPINNIILSVDEKISLVISALSLLIKNEYSTIRRLLTWLMGTNQDDDMEMGDPLIKYMIELVTASIKKIFDKNNYTKEKLSNGIKIVDQLFKQQVKLVDYVLENISIDLISCVEDYWNTNFGSSNPSKNDDILTKVKKFFDYYSSYLECLWKSLGRLLHNSVSQTEKTNEEIEYAVRLLKFCLQNIRVEDMKMKNKFYIPIISSLLKALISFNIEGKESISQIKSVLVLALRFTKDLQSIPNSNNYSSAALNYETEDGQNMININQSPSQYKHSISSILKNNDQNISLLESFKENIILYQNFYMEICKILLESIKFGRISRHDMKIFRQATELLLAIQEYSIQDGLPEWVNCIIHIVFCTDIEFSLEGINYLLDLLMINSENDVYSNIKYFLRSEEMDEHLLKTNFFQTIVQRNCCELSMAKLWILIEEQAFQKKVIDLLIKFYKADPQVFSNTISNTFAINDLEANVNAIRKFSQFWKLTSEQYPDIVFFENGECIFKMLDFLDHDHPLLRHLSKSWLSQSVGQFNKILDPLIKVLLDKETAWYISPTKQLYFAKEYDNRRVIEAFRKLKNIIINMTDLAINYFVNTPISPFLLEMDEIGKELAGMGRSIPLEHYLEIMVTISLRFIQGKFIESVSQSFYRENFSVNAASCEFLEFLLSFIEPKSKVMSIAESIAEPVLLILHECIMTNDVVMQVQLLNVLKVLLFNTQLVHKDFIKQAVNIFNSQILHDCITLGIQINYIFVRSHFISFVECCLPIFRDILDLESNHRIASKLIITTSDFLVRRVIYHPVGYNGHIAKNSLGDVQLLQNSNDNNAQRSKLFIIKNYLEQNKELKSFDENDVIVIIKGLKQILFHFLSIETPILYSDKLNWNEFKKLLSSKSNSSSFRDYLGSLFSSKSFEDSATKKNTSQLSLEIFGIFEDVLASFICCWISDSENYMSKDLCLNENGILAYNSEDSKFSNSTSEDFSFGIMKLPLSGGNKHVKSTRVLKSQIIQINLNLFVSNPFEYINKFISLWLNEKNRYINQDKMYRLSMIELLVAMNIPMEIMLIAIIRNINAAKIREVKKSKIKMKDVYPFIINKDQIVYEAKICQLIYSYIIFNYNLKVDKSIYDIWTEMINFINIFMESKAPSTLLWVYDILNIMLYKLPIRDTANDKTIKHKLTTIVSILFTKTMEMAINNKIDVCFDEPAPLITPMSPSIYEKIAAEMYDKDFSKINTPLQLKIFQPLHESKTSSLINPQEGYGQDQNVSDETVRNLYHSLFDYVSSGTILKNEELLVAYRNIGFITLKSLFYTTMKNIYLPDRNDKLTVHVQLIVKNLIAIMNERLGMNKIYIDLATEFFHSLMLNASALISNTCKTQIMDFFLEPDFFNMSKKSIRLWRDIIREFAHYYNDIISDLLNTMNSSSFFSKGTDKFKVKALRRVSFIIYSCMKDTYSNKLGLILEKVKEVITTYSENPTLEAEIFLMIRIMFLRFSHENLVEMLRFLWPIIFSELVNIIMNKKKNNPTSLTLSSLKLVEELSLANMEEFSLYQWIFFLDTFEINKMNPENQLNLINAINQSDPNSFRPVAFDLAKDFQSNSDLVVDISLIKNDEFTKRGLIMQTQKLENKEELSYLLSRLLVYSALMNNFRTKIDWDAVEHVIESDFLNDKL